MVAIVLRKNLVVTILSYQHVLSLHQAIHEIQLPLHLLSFSVSVHSLEMMSHLYPGFLCPLAGVGVLTVHPTLARSPGSAMNP